MRLALLFGIVYSAAAAAASYAGDFTGPGPCAVDAAPPAPIPVQLPPDARCGRDCLLQVTVFAPAAPAPASSSSNSSGDACPRPAAGQPVLLLYPGFQLRARFYEAHARRLASYGWAVVMYDLAPLDLVGAGVQAGWARHVVVALAAAQSSGGGEDGGGGGGVSGVRLDVSRLAAAGHSRGGKIAALHLAAESGPRFAAAYLIDPVDSDGGDDDPSAVALLAGRGLRYGISAAGVAGPCNPPARTAGFWRAAGPGSWREALPNAGHAEFADLGGGFEQRALDLLCGRGGDSHADVAELTLPAAAAWLHREVMAAAVGGGGGDGGAGGGSSGSREAQWRRRLRGQRRRRRRFEADRPPGGALAPFWAWVDRQEARGEIEFDIKE